MILHRNRPWFVLMTLLTACPDNTATKGAIDTTSSPPPMSPKDSPAPEPPTAINSEPEQERTPSIPRREVNNIDVYSPAPSQRQLKVRWRQLPKAQLRPFPDQALASWNSDAHLPLTQFIMRGHLQGVDVAPQLHAWAHQIDPSLHRKVAAYLDSEHAYSPMDLLSLLSLATNDFAARYDTVFTDTHLGPNTEMARLCFLAQRAALAHDKAFGISACPIDYAPIVQDSAFDHKLRSDPDFFRQVTGRALKKQVSQHGWWLTAPADQDMLDSFFSSLPQNVWNDIEQAANTILPHVRSGEKCATLRALLDAESPLAVASRAAEYMNIDPPRADNFSAVQLVNALSKTPMEAWQPAFEHIDAMREELAAQRNTGRILSPSDTPIELNPVSGLEIFGSLQGSEELGLMKALLIDLVGNVKAPEEKSINVTSLLLPLASATPGVRIRAAVTTLDTIAYEQSHTMARWGLPARAHTFASLSRRISAVAHCAESEHLPQARRFLYELETNGYEIIEHPTTHRAYGDQLNELFFVLRYTAPERYETLGAAARLLASDDPALNLTFLIKLGECRRVSAMSLAGHVYGVTKALQARYPGVALNPFDATELTRRICATYRAGHLSERVERAKRQIENGADAPYVTDHFDEPVGR